MLIAAPILAGEGTPVRVTFIQGNRTMKYWKDFVKAGKAIVTLENSLTGERYTYKVSQNPTNDKVWFVGILSGPDNFNDYQYLGCIWDDHFDITRKSRISKDIASFKWFNRLNDLLNSDEELTEKGKNRLLKDSFYH